MGTWLPTQDGIHSVAATCQLMTATADTIDCHAEDAGVVLHIPDAADLMSEKRMLHIQRQRPRGQASITSSAAAQAKHRADTAKARSLNARLQLLGPFLVDSHIHSLLLLNSRQCHADPDQLSCLT